MSSSPVTSPGRFGQFGGRYVSEILMPSLDQLTAAWEEASRDAAFKEELDRLLRDYVGRPTPLGEARRLCRRGQPGRRPRRAPVPQARGPVPHRRAQDQQLHRPGAAGAAHGQDPDHRRDRRRPARRGHRHRLRAVRAALRGLHGRGRRRAPVLERVPHEAAGREGPPGQERHRHPEGRHEPGAARLGDQRARHPLHHRLGGRPASLSVAGSRPAGGDRPRGPRPDPERHRPAARRGGRLRGRRLERHGPVPRLRARRRGGDLRRRGGGRGDLHRPARRHPEQGPGGRAARRPFLRAVRRRGPDRRGPLHLRRPGLPGRRSRTLPPEGHRTGPLSVGDRPPGAGRAVAARPHRGHPVCAGERPRHRRPAGGGPRAAARFQPSWSTFRAAGTRT